MSQPTIEDLYEFALNNCVIFHLPTYPIVEVHGVDAVRYLHGRLTQDVKSLAPSSGARSLMLSPGGVIQAQLLVLRAADSFFLIFDPPAESGSEEDFLKALLQFRVADQVEVSSHSAECVCYSLQGPRSAWLLQELGADTLPANEFVHCEQLVARVSTTIIRHARGTMQGFDLLLPRAKEALVKKALLQNSALLAEADEAVFEMFRILSRTPLFGKDLAAGIIAPDIPLETRASFTKGCYTGQEVVEMATSRGRPNRKFRLFTSRTLLNVSPHAAISVGISSAAEDSATVVGSVTSSCVLPSRGETAALGFIKFSVDENETFYIENKPFAIKTLQTIS